MKQILINNTPINVPTGWNDITIKHQVTLEKLHLEYPDLTSLATISAYCSIPVEEVKRMNISDVKNLLSELQFVSIPIQPEPVHEFVHHGEKFTVMETLLKSEFQDFLSLETLRSQQKEKMFHSLSTIVAILAKKPNESLDQIDLEKRSAFFDDLPLPIAYNIYLFFCAIGKTFSIDTRDTLKIQAEQIQELFKSTNATVNKLAGGGLRTRFARVILIAYLSFLQRGWKLFYFGYQSKIEKQN